MMKINKDFINGAASGFLIGGIIVLSIHLGAIREVRKALSKERELNNSLLYRLGKQFVNNVKKVG